MIRLNILDILLLIFFIYQGYKGYKKGLIKTVAPLIYWLAAFIVAVLSMRLIGGYLSQFLGFSIQTASLVGFVFVFVFAMFGFRLVIGFIDDFFSGDTLGKPNSFAGMFLGVLKGIFLGSILLLILTRLNILNTEMRTTSYFYGDVGGFVHTIWNRTSVFLPNAEMLVDKFKSNIQKNESTTPADIQPEPKPNGVN